MYQPVCILVMAHSHEELLMKLLSRLQHPQVMVAVHIDKKSQPLYEKLAKEPAISLVRNRVDVRWAHVSQVRAVFSSYNEIREAGHSFDHFIVISGQDYPLQSMEKLVEFLSAHREKSFISHVPLSREGWAGARKRYRYHYYVRMEILWRAMMMMTGIRRQFPFGLKPHGGSQWVNLSMRHMDHIIQYCNKYISLMNFMETVRFPEEILFQTLLMNSEYRDQCINDDLRFVKWLPGKSNPEILTGDHWPEIQKAENKFFARKFDLDRSAKLLQMLNEQNK